MNNFMNHNKGNLNAGAIKETMQGINPQTIMQQMMKNVPQFKKVMEYVNANGGDPQAAVYNFLQEKGVNPEEFINQLKK